MVFAPFSAHLWILTILAYLVTSLVFWLISRLSPLEQTECLWESLWGIISAFVYVSRPAPTVSTHGFYFFKTFSDFPNDKVLSGMNPKFKKPFRKYVLAFYFLVFFKQLVGMSSIYILEYFHLYGWD